MRRFFAVGLAIAVVTIVVGQGGASNRPLALTLDAVAAFPSGDGQGFPTYVTAPPGDENRVFVVRQEGMIRLIKAGVLQATPFLDITGPVLCCGEQGLLSMAFAPDYATSRRFYVYYTAASPSGQVTVAEYLRNSANPDIADPTGRIVITQAHSGASNHNGGQLQFGPDGYLYAGLGDGGGGGDPFRSGQDRTTLLGKILRIDPRPGPSSEPYTVPPDNPFVGQPPARPEIWNLGARNPWRYSFDRQTGDFTLADVGQNAWEEINFAPGATGRGLNYQWSCREGRHNYSPNFSETPCQGPPPNWTQPVLEYSHSSGCSITGGYVVRDPELPTLAGRYLYSDYCTSGINSTVLQLPDATPSLATGLSITSATSFGEDACGHIYVMGQGGGTNVWRIRDNAAPTQPCPLPRPENDTWPYPVDISAGLGAAAGTTLGATGQPEEPNHGGVAAPLNSAWYRLSLPATKVVTLDTCGSSLDTVLAVYTGSSIGALTAVGANDDFCGQQSRVVFEARAGQKYTVAVDGKGAAAGPFTLNSSATRVLPCHPVGCPGSR